jgi:glycine/D-amino acid oxidase-like deaminating enzyme
MHGEYDVVVVGAGMVGAAISYGLAGQSLKVLLLDGEDRDLRAAKANFGLVWSHGKGLGCPAYHRLSIQAVRGWPAFASNLEAESDVELAYEQCGGLAFCLSNDEFVAHRAELEQWNAQAPELGQTAYMLDRAELEQRFPTMRLGSEVVGASYGELDGHVNPLRLLMALQKAFMKRGGTLRNRQSVTDIEPLSEGGFSIVGEGFRVHAKQVLLTAGLGSARLAPMVGLDAPVSPLRGQILVTERLTPVMPVPASGLRQTAEGTVMIGVTHEDVGFDLSVTANAATKMARKAVRILPELSNAKLVRQWSALRVMTPDGNPIYASSTKYPGAHIALCHSGVTLASFHANEYAAALVSGTLSTALSLFHHERFHVQEA